MRTLHAAGFAAVLAATALVAPGGASAMQPKTYTGEFAGHIIYSNCTPAQSDTVDAGGSWSVRLYGDTAKGKFTITVNGEKHVSYPYPGMTVADPVPPGATFSVSGMTAAGLLTVTLIGDELTYTVGGGSGGYNYGGVSCDSVTYPGHLD